MEKVEMNQDILTVICAVLSHKTFILHDAWARKSWDAHFDSYKLTMDYYFSLPLPDGMHKNVDDYERILSYEFRGKEFDALKNTSYSDLGKFLWKGIS